MTDGLSAAVRSARQARAAARAATCAEPRLRVLFLCNVLTGGGAERFVSNALQMLDRERFDPLLVLFRREVVYPLPADVPVFLLHKRSPLDIPGAVWRLRKLIDELKPDILVTPHTGISLFAAEAIPLTRHRPRWLARLANDPYSQDRGLYGAVAARALRRADAFVANSRSLQQAFERKYAFARGRTHCLYNPTDFEAIDRLAGEPPAAAFRRRPALASIGRLHRQKRFDLLLEAFEPVSRRFEAELIVVGEGPLRAALESHRDRLGLRERVQFPGFLGNPYAVLAQADLFVMSSDFEGLPNVLIEAQGLGVPAIATDCPHGPAEIIRPGETGVLTPVGDPAKLTECMARLLEDPERMRRMGAAALTHARTKFSGAGMRMALEELFRSVAGRAGGEAVDVL